LAFEYTEQDLERLERALSSERLTPYLVKARGDRWVAIQLYVRNTELSEALYGVVQGFEILLRNATNTPLSKGLNDPSWWESVPLRERERNDIEDAKRNLSERGAQVSPGRMVAELGLGFWTNLYANYYERELWVRHLRSLFPLSMQRKRLHDRLNQLKLLRNRIAHHESLVRRDVYRDYQDLMETVGWISPRTRSWIESTNCFEERYAKRLPKRSQPRSE
jgi:hypothetical protein